MKKLLVWVGVVLVLLLSISAVTVYRIRDIQGDTSGAPTLKQELNNRFTETESDARYPLKADTITATSIFYTKTETDVLLKRNLLSGIQYFNPSVLAIPLASGDIMAAPYTLVDGTLSLTAFVVYKEIVVNKFCYVLQTQGVFTGDNENKFAIYSISGTTYNRVAETASDANIWKTAATVLGTKSLSSPVTLSPGAYYIGALYNCNGAAGTTPAIYQFGSISVSSQRIFGTTGHRFCSTLATQNTMPLSIANGTTAAGGVIPGIWLE